MGTRVSIPNFPSYGTQVAILGCHEWSVARLVALSCNLPVMEIPLTHLSLYHKYETLTLREMVMHMEVVNAADLHHPIILDEDGEVMDGRHRVMKALLEGRKKIKAVRFETNPAPCRIRD